MNPRTGQTMEPPPVFSRRLMRWTKRFFWGGVALFVVMVSSIALFWFFYPVHQHCIKLAGAAFRMYEDDHQGKLPYDTNGFGDALMSLVKAGHLGDPKDGWHFVTGVGDDGSAFRSALESGGHVPEEKCSRIYIQGLSELNNREIAILFDRYSSPGGDHFHRPWGPMVREVCLLDGSMEIIGEAEWANYSTKQIKLLVENGIPEFTAEHYYALTRR